MTHTFKKLLDFCFKTHKDERSLYDEEIDDDLEYDENDYDESDLEDEEGEYDEVWK